MTSAFANPSQPQLHKRGWPFLIGAWLILIILAASSTLALAQPAERGEFRRPGLISVAGIGTVNAEPDMAVVTSGVVTEAKTAREALTANNQAMAALIAQLKEQDIEDRDLMTSGFQVQPRYQNLRPKPGEAAPPPKIVAYEVRNTLTVRIRALENLGAIIDQMVNDGANQMNGIQFTFADPVALRDEARTKAIADARKRAEQIAAGLGVALGPIHEVSEGHNARPVPMMRVARAEAMAADSVPVQAGEQSLSVTVNAIWRIDQ